jgi:ParB family chromosome partitioning protein
MTTDIRTLPLASIECRPQVREHFGQAELQGLATSIRELGLQSPILVWPTGATWTVIDGERRVRACRLLGHDYIEAIVHNGDPGTAELVQRQLVANVQNAQLKPVERARAIERLMRETGWNHATVAGKLGVSPATVSRLMALLVLPQAIREQVDAGDVAASSAYEAAKVRDGAKRKEVLQEIAQGGLSREAVKSLVRGTPRPATRRGRRPSAPRPRVRIQLGQGYALAGPATDAMNVAVLRELINVLLDRLGGFTPTTGLTELAALLRGNPVEGQR